MMKKICVGMVLSGWLLTFPAIAQNAGWNNSFDDKPKTSQLELGDKTVPVALDAGWVNHFDGIPNNYLIKRGSETIPVGLFTVLQVGDEISVNDKQHTIELSLRGGTQPVWVTSQNSPFVVEQNSMVSTEREPLWAWIKQIFSDWHKITQSVQSHDGIAFEQHKTLTMPLLENVRGPARLVAGKRTLHFQWYGGHSPYRVVIYQRREMILNQSNLLEPVVNTELLNFEARKPYRVMLFAATGQFMGGFRAFEAEQMPTSPKILADANLPENLRRTLQATWLVMQENGQWIFEAYQLVAPLTNYRAAQILKEALARGVDREVIRDRGIRG
jgi:hypothetical protein